MTTRTATEQWTKVPVLPAVVGALILLAAGVEAQAPRDSMPDGVTPEAMQEGYERFQALSCRSCHGDMGRGGRPGGPNLRDDEWLHSQGDYEGILHTIRWGVKKEDHRAQTRQWDMRPRGGEYLNSQQVSAIAAYVWGQSRGLFRASEEDRLVDRIFNHGMVEVGPELEAHQGDFPISEGRLLRVAFDLLSTVSPLEGQILFEIGLDTYPNSQGMHRGLGIAHARQGNEAQARTHLERALELGPADAVARQWLERLGGGRSNPGINATKEQGIWP